jgi:hypothetical protein
MDYLNSFGEYINKKLLRVKEGYGSYKSGISFDMETLIENLSIIS